MTVGPQDIRVAIVLVNWNGWRDTVECLSSIFAADAAACADVYVVDNASTDGSIDRIAGWCNEVPADEHPRFDGVRHLPPGTRLPCRIRDAEGRPLGRDPAFPLTLVKAGGNLGYAGGNNVGIVAAGAADYSHYWLLNTDTVIRHDALDRLLERALASPDVGMVGSTLIYYREPALLQAMGGAELDERTAIPNHLGDRQPVVSLPTDARPVEDRMSYVVGASMLVTRPFVEQVGPMQEDYFLYYEEADWSYRGRPTFKPAWAPGSVVYHKVGSSSSQPMSEFALESLYRSRFRFTRRFLPHRLRSVRRMVAFEVIRHIAKGRWMPARVAARTWLAERTMRGQAAAARLPSWR